MPKDEGGSSSCADPSCAGCSAQFASTITRLPRDTLESLLHEVVMDPSRAAHLRPALERLGAALGTPAKDKQRWEELNPQELVAARALGVVLARVAAEQPEPGVALEEQLHGDARCGGGHATGVHKVHLVVHDSFAARRARVS